MPLQSSPGDLPLLIEAKSAGDFTNPNPGFLTSQKKTLELAKFKMF